MCPHQWCVADNMVGRTSSSGREQRSSPAIFISPYFSPTPPTLLPPISHSLHYPSHPHLPRSSSFSLFLSSSCLLMTGASVSIISMDSIPSVDGISMNSGSPSRGTPMWKASLTATTLPLLETNANWDGRDEEGIWMCLRQGMQAEHVFMQSSSGQHCPYRPRGRAGQHHVSKFTW